MAIIALAMRNNLVLSVATPELLRKDVFASIAAIQVGQNLGAVGRAFASGDASVHRKLLRESIERHVPTEIRPGLLQNLTEVLAPGGTQRTPEASADLKVKDVAKMENVTSPTVRGWITSGSLRAHLVGQAGKRQSYRIAQTDYAEFRRRTVSRGSLPDPSADAMKILVAKRGVGAPRKE